jgi:hypothetical protein
MSVFALKGGCYGVFLFYLLFCLLAVEMMVGFGGDEVDGMLMRCCVAGVGSGIVGLWLIPCLVDFSLIGIL